MTMHTPIRGLKTLIILALFAGAFATATRAQAQYSISGRSATMTLYGTSTLHDWNMVAHAFTGTGTFTISPDNQLMGLSALTVDLPVHNLKSEHDGMNDNAYDALKADDHKDLVFKLSSATVAPAGGNKYTITAHGNLSIAGVTKPETMTVSAAVNSDGSISCSGTLPLKLSEFNIERPSFMLGTMKVGDALTLNYSLIFVK